MGFEITRSRSGERRWDVSESGVGPADGNPGQDAGPSGE